MGLLRLSVLVSICRLCLQQELFGKQEQDTGRCLPCIFSMRLMAVGHSGV